MKKTPVFSFNDFMKATNNGTKPLNENDGYMAGANPEEEVLDADAAMPAEGEGAEGAESEEEPIPTFEELVAMVKELKEKVATLEGHEAEEEEAPEGEEEAPAEGEEEAPEA